jgi:tRNA A-37 threonylcarbamoyl transferase component Bud32
MRRQAGHHIGRRQVAEVQEAEEAEYSEGMEALEKAGVDKKGLMSAIGAALARLHATNIIHGDLTIVRRRLGIPFRLVFFLRLSLGPSTQDLAYRPAFYSLHAQHSGILPKTYRHPTLDATLTRTRLNFEARALARCTRAGVTVPKVLWVDENAGVLGMRQGWDVGMSWGSGTLR